MAFRDRIEAGRVLGQKLSAYRGRGDVVVLGLPRGGVPVAEQVALALGAPLDVFVVRKLGTPGHEELAMGAIASGGIRVLNQPVIDDLGISDAAIEKVAASEQVELDRRERAYRRGRPAIDVQNKVAILVDDGLATGASMRAAVHALRAQKAGAIVVATPIGAPDTCHEMGKLADDVVCAVTPQPFGGVGRWYEDFSQTSDAEVEAALARTGSATAMAAGNDNAPAPPASPVLGPRRIQPPGTADLTALCRQHARPLRGSAADDDDLVDQMAGARLVLIGEASHGTHEFYRERARLTQRLITEKGFTAVAAEADWPDAYRVNRYVRGQGPDVEAVESLAGFARFPAWMWRNADVLDFVGWLREHNDQLPMGAIRSGFYGLDLYSLYASMDAVITYLDRADPAAAARARERYACFDQTGDDGQQYGFSAGVGMTESCEKEVLDQLAELRRHAPEFAGGSPLAADEFFFAEQNARVAKNAEEYYRAMFHGRVSSWNLRDRHMMDTLEALLTHLDQNHEGGEGQAKVVVWAHNSHLGDARATDMGAAGELNLGQLVRQKYGAAAFLLGLTTDTGSVTAASQWGGPAERKAVRPALPGSYEAIFHACGLPRFWLRLDDGNPATAALRTQRLERAIGVIYLPQTERASHYFYARLPDQFDAVIHIDQTRALEPLDQSVKWQRGEVPETFPSAL